MLCAATALWEDEVIRSGESKSELNLAHGPSPAKGRRSIRLARPRFVIVTKQRKQWSLVTFETTYCYHAHQLRLSALTIACVCCVNDVCLSSLFAFCLPFACLLVSLPRTHLWTLAASRGAARHARAEVRLRLRWTTKRMPRRRSPTTTSDDDDV